MIKEEEIQELFRQHDGGRFEVRKILGIGGMGVVVQAFDVKLEVLRAIKIFNPELLAQESLVRRFKQEARIMAKINHANIVQVFDVGEVGTYHYMVLEWIDGGSLAFVIRPLDNPDGTQTLRPMHPRVALLFIYSVCDALAFAHKRGVIHRDIKPDNILITNEGIPKVTDFGIAHMDDDQKKRVTSTGEAMGTEGYASPQQLSNFSMTDARDDVYSVAVTFWALMTGKSPPSILFFHDIESRVDMLETIPTSLHSILKKATAYNPSERYQTMDEFAQALRETEAELPPIGGHVIFTIRTDDDVGVMDPTAIGATRIRGNIRLPEGELPEPTRVAKPVAIIEPKEEIASVRDGNTLAYRPSGEVMNARVISDEGSGISDQKNDASEFASQSHRRSFLIATSVLCLTGLGIFLWAYMRPSEISPKPSVIEQKSVSVMAQDVVQSSIDASTLADVSTTTDTESLDTSSKTESDVPEVVAQVPIKPIVEKRLDKKEHKFEKGLQSIEVKAGETLVLKPEIKKTTLTTPQPPPSQGGGEQIKVQVGLKIPSDDTVRVWLVGQSGKHKLPASVTPGFYKVVAIFKDQDNETVIFPKYEVIEGTTPLLKCDSAREVCQKL